MALKTCTRPAGSVTAYGKIEIRLSQDTVITATSANYLAAPIEVTAAADGSVSVQLQANNDLTPNNTYYTVTEFAGTTDSTYFVQVPQTAGPFVLTSIQVSVPPAPAPPSSAHLSTLLVDGATTVTGAAALNGGLTVQGTVVLPAASVADAALSSNVALLNGGQTFSVAPTFGAGATFPSSSGIVSMGTGDSVPYHGVDGTAWEMTSQQGTAGSPITTGSGPVTKVTRTESIPASTMPGGNGANNWGNACLLLSATGDASNQAQVSGLLATTQNASTQTRTANAINIDATAIQGFGNIIGSGKGNGIGGYFEGRVDSAAAGAGANGAEFRVNNQSGSDGAYVATGFSGTVGVWVTAGSSSTPGRISGAAIQVALTNSCQWDVGLGFATIGGVSAVKTTSISDDSNSVTSIKINGTHTNSLVIANTAGPALIGGTTALSGTTDTRLELQAKTSGGTDPVLFIGSTSAAVNHTMWIRNSSGVNKIGVAGSAGQLVTGTVAGDFVIQATTSGKFTHIGGTISAIKIGQDNSVVFQPIATPAGGSAAASFGFGSGPGPGIYFGSGAPTVSAPKGSLYLRTDGTTTNDRAFVNTNGTTTWTALTTVA